MPFGQVLSRLGSTSKERVQQAAWQLQHDRQRLRQHRPKVRCMGELMRMPGTVVQACYSVVQTGEVWSALRWRADASALLWSCHLGLQCACCKLLSNTNILSSMEHAICCIWVSYGCTQHAMHLSAQRLLLCH